MGEIKRAPRSLKVKRCAKISDSGNKLKKIGEVEQRVAFFREV